MTCPAIKAEPIDEEEETEGEPLAPAASEVDQSEAERVATISTIDYDQTKVTNTIERLAKLLPMVGHDNRDIANCQI